MEIPTPVRIKGRQLRLVLYMQQRMFEQTSISSRMTSYKLTSLTNFQSIFTGPKYGHWAKPQCKLFKRITTIAFEQYLAINETRSGRTMRITCKESPSKHRKATINSANIRSFFILNVCLPIMQKLGVPTYEDQSSNSICVKCGCGEALPNENLCKLWELLPQEKSYNDVMREKVHLSCYQTKSFMTSGAQAGKTSYYS